MGVREGHDFTFDRHLVRLGGLLEQPLGLDVISELLQRAKSLV